MLKNDSIEATIEEGMLVKLTDRVSGQALLGVNAADRKTLQISLSQILNLDQCKVTQQASGDSVTSKVEAADGREVDLHWQICGPIVFVPPSR